MPAREIIRSLDWIAALATALLVMLGIVMLFSTTSDQALLSPLLYRQAISLIIGSVVYGLISFVPYHHLRRYALPVYGLALAALVLVSQIGEVIRGTTSRLSIMGVQLQPSEFMKVALVLIMAWLFTQNVPWRIRLVLSALFVWLAVLIIALEPDIGMAALFILFWGAFVFFLGISWRAVATLGVCGLAVLLAAWRYFLAEYQRARIITFLNPAGDPLGAGYNIVQSIIALGSGHWFGRGLGHGPQSQLKFLPEQHTDFILASLGEELGFVGVLLFVSLYSILLWRILRVAKVTRDQFGLHLAVGVYLVLLINFFLSASVNMGLVPVTGLPLPLISYGGSNLVSTLALLAIVQSINLHNKWVRTPPVEIAHLT
ncbi:MAG: rod shape-determining protein RodA [Candidatus Andersenbacteria bacterium]|nr:rod shape-determining protein RodA [Candidatus Andersenbacteria bacterium]